MVTSDVRCATCDDPQTQHKGGTGGCRHCDLGCGKFEPIVDPVPAEDLAAIAAAAKETITVETAAPVPDDQLPTLARLREVEAERDELAEQLVSARKSYEWLDGVAANLRESGDLAQATLTQVEAAAGRDIAKPDEGIVDRVADLLSGRTEATERALRLAAELANAAQRNEDLLHDVGMISGLHHEAQQERDQARADLAKKVSMNAGLLAEVDRLTAVIAATTGVDALLERATATGRPAIVHVVDQVRALAGQLEQHMVAHERVEQLRAREAVLEEELAEIRQQIADADPAPAPEPSDKVVREWGIKVGHPDVLPRGRVSDLLRAAYKAAMSG